MGPKNLCIRWEPGSSHTGRHTFVVTLWHTQTFCSQCSQCYSLRGRTDVASGWGYQSVVATFIIVVVAYLFVAADFCLYI